MACAHSSAEARAWGVGAPGPGRTGTAPPPDEVQAQMWRDGTAAGAAGRRPVGRGGGPRQRDHPDRRPRRYRRILVRWTLMRHFLRRALRRLLPPRSKGSLPGRVLAPARPTCLIAPTRLSQRPLPSRPGARRAAVDGAPVATPADPRLPPASPAHEQPRRLHRQGLPRRGTGASVPTGAMLHALLQQRRLAGRGWAVGGCVKLPPSCSSRIRASLLLDMPPIRPDLGRRRELRNCWRHPPRRPYARSGSESSGNRRSFTPCPSSRDRT